jgi:hypothetical protein
MVKRLDLNELKSKYLNKTFGWLTVIDVYRDSEKRRYFLNASVNVAKKLVSLTIK